jgi:amino acid adenylation domain-containing protein/non-ribosomal peptide synthase protein (TIGR01720 family)
MIMHREAISSADPEATQRAQAAQLLQESGENESFFRLSSAQHRLWFFEQLQPDTALYNLAAAIRIEGALDRAALQRSLQAIVERHETLRTAFVNMIGQPLQRILAEASLALPVHDLRRLPPSEQAAEVQRRAEQEARRPFDLSVAPLLRTTLLQLADDAHVLLLTMHHIISDGWSMGLFVRDLTALYSDEVGGADGARLALPELPIQYADYAEWQLEQLALAGPDNELAQRLDYWRTQLAGAPPVLELPTDHPRPATPSYRGAQYPIALPAALSKTLQQLSQREGVTLYMTLLAAFQTLLARYTGQDDIVVGSPIANRTQGETEDLIGMFVNTLALRSDLGGDPSFRELLQQVRATALAAYARQDVPFELLVQTLQLDRDLNHAPLVQVLFVLQNTPMPPLALAGLKVELEPIDTGTAKFDLTLNLTEQDDGLVGWFEYDTDLFTPATIARMAAHFENLLSGIAADPDQRIQDLELLTAAERRQLLVDWNQTATAYSLDQPLHALIEAQAARTPDAVALRYQDASLSYAALDARANQLAHYLRALGVGPETRVGICMERSLDLVVALLGVLKAGGAYVPLDPAYPADRLQFMLEDSRVAVLLSQAYLEDALPPLDPTLPVVRLDRDWPAIDGAPATAPQVALDPEHPAYMIYTSGSTGRPKGAINRHRAIVNRLLWMQQQYQLDASDRVLQKTPMSFDVSVWEFFWPLMTGATLVLARPGGHQDPAYLVELIQQRQITTLHFVPSMLQAFVDARDVSGCTSIRRVICSGEALPYDLQQRCFARLAAAELHNLYGPTEAAVDVTYWACQRDSARRSVPIGRPIANTQVYVLDAAMQPTPIGVAGELYLGGVQLARGYHQRPALTAATFIPDPFSADAGARLYKTGDLVRWLADGVIEYLGRIDHQVKLRGFRIELGEIESALNQHPDVRDSVVLLREMRGDKQLVAYVVGEQRTENREQGTSEQGRTEATDHRSLTSDHLRAFLAQRLPGYMIPAAFVTLDALPLTPNGKLDRRALPAPEQTRSTLSGAYVAPRNEIERQLAAIWRDVLGVEQIGVDDPFFALGGHSLLATQVVSRVRDMLGVELPLRTLFEAPTIAGMAARIEQTATDGPRGAPVAALPSDALPLSFAQRRLWLLRQLDPDNVAYTIATAVRLRGALDQDALASALNTIIERHAALRTTFREWNGQPYQVIAPELRIDPPLRDLREFPAAQRELLAQRELQQAAHEPFDLERGPLVRAQLLRLDDQHYLLGLLLDHSVSDGWSLGVLVQELAALYKAGMTGAAAALPAPTMQYADYAAWQRDWAASGALTAQLDYWKRQLAGATVLELPADRPRPAAKSWRGAMQQLSLPRALVDELAALSRREDATLYMTLLAGLQALLYRYTGQQDIVVGSPIANRLRPEFEDLIGCFINTLALRANVSGDLSFRALLDQVREITLQAYDHQSAPFEQVVEALQLERDLSRPPLVQVMFALQNMPIPALRLPGLTLEPVEIDTGAAQLDLTLNLIEAPEGLRGWITYNTDLFDAATITRFVGHLRALLASAVADPDQRIQDLELLTEAERRQLIHDWNATERDYPRERCIHELIEAQTARTPDSIAVRYEDASLTYRELNERANQLAHYLQQLGVGPETRVGISVDRSFDLLVSVLGVLKAGGAYVPLDPTYPADRIAFILEDAQVPVLLTQTRWLSEAPPSAGPHTVQRLCLDRDWSRIAQQPTTPVASAATAENLAYVMYTSGSTGKPKGVQVLHRTVNNFLFSMREQPGLSEQDVLLAVTSLSFDISGLELFLPLLVGAQLVLVSQEAAADGAQLQTLVAQAGASAEGATVLQTTPSRFQLLVQAGWSGSDRLRMLVGGEALSREIAAQLLPRGASLWNMYGPTETTIWSTLAAVTDAEQAALVGGPIANTTIYLLDAQLRPTPIGVPGELFIGGEGLARGYHNRPALTAEKFVPDPWSAQPGARMYRTGDLARWRSAADGAGAIEFLGRIDHQVKLRGYRIELGEIESVLTRHPAVQQAVVVMRVLASGASGSAAQQLVAYVVPGEPGENQEPRTKNQGTNEQGGAAPSDHRSLTTDHLRSFLRAHVPDYMIPAVFVTLDALPLTPNGKIDRKALPEPTQSNVEEDADYAAPRTPAEQMLAAIWSDLLGRERVGIHDNFFALGGHSLLATQLAARVRIESGADLPLRTLFEAPTVAGLAALLDADASLAEQRPPLTAQPRTGRPPLSFAQQRLWFLQQFDRDLTAYNVPAAVRLSGQLDRAALHSSLQAIVARHETLRTTFRLDDGQPIQVIDPTATLDLPLIDLAARQANLRPAQREVEVQRLALEEAQQPFDLERGPLIRTRLLRLSESEHVLLLCMHHIVGDGWSLGVLIQELAALYPAQPAAAPLPALPVQYADFAIWQRGWLQGEALQQQLDYWKRQLAGAATLDLPTDYPRPSTQTYRGMQRSRTLAPELLAALNQLAQQQDATLYMVLLAAFQTLLHRTSGQDDIVIGSAIAGRNYAELEGIIGMFVNMLVMRGDLSGNPRFDELLSQARETALGAFAHQDAPFEKIVEAIQPARDASRSPLFQIVLTLQNTPIQPLALPNLVIEPIELDQGSSRFDISLNAVESEAGLLLVAEFNTDLFRPVTIERMLERFETLLEGVVAAPERRLTELPLLPAAEQALALRAWNDTAHPFSPAPIFERISAQAARRPDAVAVVGPASTGGQLSYRELEARSNQLAHHLRALGIGPEVRVGICVERSLEMIVGILGILKAGGAYVPLDPTYPPDRLQFMLEDAAVPVLLTQQRLIERGLPQHTAQVIALDANWPAIAEQPSGAPVSMTAPEHLAYLIYTSGSTGTPKGVMIPHRAVSNFIASVIDLFDVTEADRVLQFASFCFDVSVFEIFTALSSGATLCLTDRDTLLAPQAFTRLMQEQRISIIDVAPAVMSLLPADAFPDLRIVFVGGESFSGDLVNRWALPGRRFFNGYGPTEATVTMTVYECQGQFNATPPIGRAMRNHQVYVLDQHLRPVPIGTPGQLCIGGAGLARGYHQRPGLTAEKFMPDPFSAEPGARLYASGDLVRWLADGELEFLGRIDQQVKLRGLRVELGEIQAVLQQHPALSDAAVIAREEQAASGRTDKRLVAYVVAADAPPSSDELYGFLQTRLPAFMIPSAFVTMDALPLTPSGKLERKALPAPETTRTAQDQDFIAPTNQIEQLLARISAQVLGVEQVGIHDNFFTLGGDSIASIQVVARANEAGLNITAKQLFEHQTIAAMASLVRPAASSAVDQQPVIGPAPLTPIQRWFFDQNLPEPQHWNQAVLLDVRQPLDPALLEQAVGAIISHHDALRLRFTAQAIGWDQTNAAPDGVIPFSVHDLSALAAAEQGPALEALATELQASLDLTAGPLLRVALVRRDADESGWLLVIMHHLVVDGVSWRIVLEDLQSAYRQLSQGQAVALPLKTTSFQDWAHELAAYGQSEALREEAAFWTDPQRYGSMPLPLDLPGGENSEASARTVTAELSAAETRALLHELPQAYQTQINDVLLAALAQALAPWTGSSALLLDLEGHGREDLFDDVDVSRTVGWFTSVFPVWLELPASGSPVDALLAVQAQLQQIPNRGVGYGALRYLCQDMFIAMRLGLRPPADVIFNYLGQFDQLLPAGSPFSLSSASSGPARHPASPRSYVLEISGGVTGGQLRLSWTYSANLHQQATIERLADAFIAALRTLIDQAQAAVSAPGRFPLVALEQRDLDRLLAAAGRVEEIAPLAPMQRDILDASLRLPETGVYIPQLCCTLRGPLEVDLFQAAWRQALERHEILRTGFHWQNLPEPVQVVQAETELPWFEHDLRDLSAAEQERWIEQFVLDERVRGFDLSAPPLMRLAVLHRADDLTSFVWSFHHLLIDGWSFQIVLGEVFASYLALRQGQAAPAVDHRPYRDYIAWLQEQDIGAAEAYWRRMLADFQAPAQSLAQPTADDAPDAAPYHEEQAQLTPAASAALTTLARTHQLTVNTLVQGAWSLVLSHRQQSDDLAFGVTFSSRPAQVAGVEAMVGLHINTLPVRVQFDPDAAALPWLRQLQAEQAELRQYEYSSLRQAQAWSGAAGPLFESTLRFQNYPVDRTVEQGLGDLDVVAAQVIDHWHYPLNVAVTPGAQLTIAAVYDERCFDQAQIKEILAQFSRLLAAMAEQIDQPIAALRRRLAEDELQAFELGA